MEQQVIHKYGLEIQDRQLVMLPRTSTILCVQVQRGEIQLWAQHYLTQNESFDRDSVKTHREAQWGDEHRVIRIHGTGHKYDIYPNKYIGTVQLSDGWSVFHVFEEL